MPNILAIDFDGVIMQRERRKSFREIARHYFPTNGRTPGRMPLGGELIPGTREALAELSEEWGLVLHTCRATSPGGSQSVTRYLKDRKLDQYFDRITVTKPSATAYIDDKGFRFTTWAEVVETFKGEA